MHIMINISDLSQNKSNSVCVLQIPEFLPNNAQRVQNGGI